MKLREIDPVEYVDPENENLDKEKKVEEVSGIKNVDNDKKPEQGVEKKERKKKKEEKAKIRKSKDETGNLGGKLDVSG